LAKAVYEYSVKMDENRIKNRLIEYQGESTRSDGEKAHEKMNFHLFFIFISSIFTE